MTRLEDVGAEMKQRRTHEESTKELAGSLATLEAHLAKDADLKNSVEEKQLQLKDYLSVKDKIEKIERFVAQHSTVPVLSLF